jgi:hypothetical protein
MTLTNGHVNREPNQLSIFFCMEVRKNMSEGFKANGTLGLKLAPPTFVAGPQEETATADVYKASGNKVVTSVQDITKSLNVDLKDVLRGGLYLQKNLPIVTGLLKGGGTAINKTALVTRLLAGSSSLTNTLRSLTGGLTKAIGSNMLSDAINVMPTAFATVNGVMARISATNLNDISSVGRMINDVTKQADLFSINDKDSTVGLLSGLVSEATRYGIPNSVEGVLRTIEDPYILRKVGALVLPDVVKAGDATGLRSLSSFLSEGSVNLLNPNIVREFTGNYQTPLACTAEDNINNYSDVMDAFRKVDTKWDRLVRTTQSGVDEVLDISKLQSASTSFRKVVTMGASTVSGEVAGQADHNLYQLANVFHATSVDQELSKSFPKTVVGISSRVSAAVVSPTAESMQAAQARIEAQRQEDLTRVQRQAAIVAAQAKQPEPDIFIDGQPATFLTPEESTARPWKEQKKEEERNGPWNNYGNPMDAPYQSKSIKF